MRIRIDDVKMAINYAKGMKEAGGSESFDVFIDTTISVLKKQIPKKPTLYEDKYYGCDCGNVLAFKNEAPGLTYCLNCGQAIDWSDNE